MKKSLLLICLAVLAVVMTSCGAAQTGGTPAKSESASKQTDSGSSANEQSGAKDKAGRQQTQAKKEQPLTKVKIGYDGFSMSTGPLNYTHQKGIFRKYGLDVELIFINGGSTLTQALVGGSVDIGQNGYTPAAEAIVSGADLVFIGGINNKFPFQMVVKENIQTADQLKGKKIAISKFGSSTDQAAEMATQFLGLKKSDVTILQLGGAGERYAAALSGQIDGSMEQYDNTIKLLKKGFRIMIDLTDLAGEYPNTAYVVKRDYTKKNPETVKNFFKAISEGIYEYKKNRDEAIQLTADFFKMDNPKELEETYDFFTKKVYPDIPKPSMKGLELVLQEIAQNKPKAKELKPEQMVDITAIDALEKEGFFSSLSSKKE